MIFLTIIYLVTISVVSLPCCKVYPNQVKLQFKLYLIFHGFLSFTRVMKQLTSDNTYLTNSLSLVKNLKIGENYSFTIYLMYL